MFCPNCKTEYRPGFATCSDCGAPLVERLAAKEPEPRTMNTAGPELLWSGTNPAIRSTIVSALDDADIPHHESKREVGPLPGLSQAVYAIFIPAQQREAGRAAMAKGLAEFQDGAPETEDDETSDSESFPGFSDDADDDQPVADDVVSENYNPDDATQEVWSGSDVELKDMLVASLRENGIGCELTANGAFRILVMPSDQTRASEIVREVLDASPPK